MLETRIRIVRSRLPLVALGAAALLLLVAAPAFSQGITRGFDVGHGGLLTVDAEGSSVEVRGTGGSSVRIHITRKDDSAAEIEEDYRVVFDQNGDSVGLLVERIRRRQLLDWNRKGLKIVAEVPDRYDLNLRTSGGSLRISDLDGSIEGKTSGGSISLADSTGDVNVQTSGGSIQIGTVGGRVDASTSGGSISIDRAGAEVIAETSGGSIEVREVHGPIRASTSGGSVRAYLAEQPTADCSLSTSGGTVTVHVDDSLALDIDANASGGSVRTDLRVDASVNTKTKLKGALNGGGPTLKLRSSGGGVRVLAGS